jgi:DNA polymerase-3 subunit gamma/tau
MSSDVLALKYRPKFFNEVTGQDLVIETLSNSITLNKLHNAYLFSGTRGMGKTTIARLLAKSLLCKEGITAEPCGKCSTCLEIDAGNHLDLIEIDAASRTKVEDTRTLMDNVQYLPSSSRYKVYLIDEVHMLSTKSFNALLKTIEEPPEHVKFLMATTEPEKLPETVLSRCLHFKLAPATNNIIIEHLENILKSENIEHDIESLESISNTANSSIRDSLSILEQCISFCNGKLEYSKVKLLLGEIDFKLIQNIVIHVSEKDAESLINNIEEIKGDSDFEKITDVIINIFYKITLLKIKPDSINTDDVNYDFYKSISQNIELEDLQLYYQIAISSKKDYKFSQNKKDHFSMTFLRMVLFSGNANDNSGLEKGNKENLFNGKSNTEKLVKESTGKADKTDKEEKEINYLDDNSWTETIDKLSISGLTLHLANHSLFSKTNKDEPVLKISEDKRDIYPKTCISDLINKIKIHFNINSNIEVSYEKDLLTPIIIEEIRQQNQLNDVYKSVKDDPSVNKIQKIFNADIKKESIKKITD